MSSIPLCMFAHCKSIQLLRDQASLFICNGKVTILTKTIWQIPVVKHCTTKSSLVWRSQKYLLKCNIHCKNVTAQLNYSTPKLTSVKPLPNIQWPLGSSLEYMYPLKKDSTSLQCIPPVNSWFLSCMSHFSLPVPSSVFSCLTVPLQDQTKATSKGFALVQKVDSYF